MRNAVSRALREAARVSHRRAEPAPSGAARRAQLRQGGRALLLALYTALRSLKLYPVENATVQKALDDLRRHRARAAGAREPSWRSAWPATSSSSTRPGSASSSTTTPRSATSWPCSGPSTIGALRIARGGRPARVADLPEPAAQPRRARRRRTSRFEELLERLAAARRPRTSRSSAPAEQERRPRRRSRRRRRPSGSTRRAWRSPRT